MDTGQGVESETKVSFTNFWYYSTVCPIVPGQVEVWQNGQSSLAAMTEKPIFRQQKIVPDLTSSPALVELWVSGPHLHGHLEDAEAVGERAAAAREGVRPQRHPPRPPADGALRHERGLPASRVAQGRGSTNF